MKLYHSTLICGLLLASMVFSTCKPHLFRQTYQEHNKLIHENQNIAARPFLKAHMRNGDVGILGESWVLDPAATYLEGNGTLYDFNRKKIVSGKISLRLDSIVLYETNRKLKSHDNARMAALGVLGAIDLGLGAYCIINPKMCFGSCPTFYTNETVDKDVHYSNAEGFSDAIAPFLEASDIDAIQHAGEEPEVFITMKNEAMETHCVNDVNLYAVKKEKNESVFQSPRDEFYVSNQLLQPVSALAPEGDIHSIISDPDKKERFSMADENDLAAKEELYFTFNSDSKINDAGLVINFRQTLMTTYFIYNALAYMGDEVTDLLAGMSGTKQATERWKNFSDQLGAIEVYTWDPLKVDWIHHGGFYETGPIAINQQILPLPLASTGNTLKVKLAITKGLWRLDRVALACNTKIATPVKVKPSEILKQGIPDKSSLEAIQDPDQYLISMPGNTYRFRFDLPAPAPEYALFLYSKGYYLEWMREGWYREKNLPKLGKMMLAPTAYFKSEAKQYKVYEAQMEKDFWNSRIPSTKISQHGR